MKTHTHTYQECFKDLLAKVPLLLFFLQKKKHMVHPEGEYVVYKRLG